MDSVIWDMKINSPKYTLIVSAMLGSSAKILEEKINYRKYLPYELSVSQAENSHNLHRKAALPIPHTHPVEKNRHQHRGWIRDVLSFYSEMHSKKAKRLYLFSD